MSLYSCCESECLLQALGFLVHLQLSCSVTVQKLIVNEHVPTSAACNCHVVYFFCYSLTGQLPFEGDDKPAIKAAILRGQMKPLPTSLRPECVSFMSMMLARNPQDRASAHDLLQHPFIRMYSIPARAHSGGLAVSKQPMSRRCSKETVPILSELKGVQRKSSSNASSGQGGPQTLPLSFSLRHNELADPTVPERMVLKVGAASLFCNGRMRTRLSEPCRAYMLSPISFIRCCTLQVEACSHDSTDSLIRAQHTALLDYGGSMSSSNSMTCATSSLLESPRAGSSLARGKSKSPLQLETRSWSASQMRSMSADRRASAISSPSFLRKVAVMFRSMLSNTSMDEEPSHSSK